MPHKNYGYDRDFPAIFGLLVSTKSLIKQFKTYTFSCKSIKVIKFTNSYSFVKDDSLTYQISDFRPCPVSRMTSGAIQ